MATNKIYNNVVFVSVSGGKDSNPACATNNAWSYVMSFSSDLDKATLALLLQAKAANTAVTLVGSGACDVFGQIETLQEVTAN